MISKNSRALDPTKRMSARSRYQGIGLWPCEA